MTSSILVSFKAAFLYTCNIISWQAYTFFFPRQDTYDIWTSWATLVWTLSSFTAFLVASFTLGDNWTKTTQSKKSWIQLCTDEINYYLQRMGYSNTDKHGRVLLLLAQGLAPRCLWSHPGLGCWLWLVPQSVGQLLPQWELPDESEGEKSWDFTQSEGLWCRAETSHFCGPLHGWTDNQANVGSC